MLNWHSFKEKTLIVANRRYESYKICLRPLSKHRISVFWCEYGKTTPQCARSQNCQWRNWTPMFRSRWQRPRRKPTGKTTMFIFMSKRTKDKRSAWKPNSPAGTWNFALFASSWTWESMVNPWRLCYDDWESVVPKAELNYIMGNPPLSLKKEKSKYIRKSVKKYLHTARWKWTRKGLIFAQSAKPLMKQM